MAITDFGAVTTREGSRYGYVASLAGRVWVQEPFTDTPTLIRLRDTDTGPVTISPLTLEEIWQNAGDPDLPYMDLAGDRYIRTDVKPENLSLPEGWNWEEPGWFMVGFGGIADFDYEQIWSTDLW